MGGGIIIGNATNAAPWSSRLSPPNDLILKSMSEKCFFPF